MCVPIILSPCPYDPIKGAVPAAVGEVIGSYAHGDRGLRGMGGCASQSERGASLVCTTLLGLATFQIFYAIFMGSHCVILRNVVAGGTTAVPAAVAGGATKTSSTSTCRHHGPFIFKS